MSEKQLEKPGSDELAEMRHVINDLRAQLQQVTEERDSLALLATAQLPQEGCGLRLETGLLECNELKSVRARTEAAEQRAAGAELKLAALEQKQIEMLASYGHPAVLTAQRDDLVRLVGRLAEDVKDWRDGYFGWAKDEGWADQLVKQKSWLETDALLAEAAKVTTTKESSQ